MWVRRPYIRAFLYCQHFTSQYVIHFPTSTISSLSIPLTPTLSQTTMPPVPSLSNSSNHSPASSTLPVVLSTPFQIHCSQIRKWSTSSISPPSHITHLSSLYTHTSSCPEVKLLTLSSTKTSTSLLHIPAMS